VNVQVWRCDDEEDGCPEMARGWIAEARYIAAMDPTVGRALVALLRDAARWTERFATDEILALARAVLAKDAP
jgi:hypothetical protein